MSSGDVTRVSGRDPVRGVYAFAKKLEARAAKKVRAFQVGVRKAGYYIFQLSQTLVPVDTGFLKASGKMKFGGSGTQFTFTIEYTAPYAIFVHEDLSVYHPNGQAKFLEAAMRQGRGYARDVVLMELNKA